MKTPIPTHRILYDRRTGRPVGPAVPIHPEDWPYSDIHPSEILWRYMDFWKFEDLLKTSVLFFSQPARFKDPFEGRFVPANSQKMSPSDAAFHAAYPINLSPKALEASQEAMRKCVFISCWQRCAKECREMWNAYTEGAESVVITSSGKALHRFLPEHIQKSPVKYHSDDFPRTEFSHLSIFFFKPAEYSFEREFRLLLAPGETEVINLSEAGRPVRVRTKKITHRVISHPDATDEFKAKVDTLMAAHLKHIKREDSALRH